METVDTAPAELVSAFHMMWDSFPGVCSLIHKSRTIVAANPASRGIGREPGTICAQNGPPENHKGCLAAKVLASGQPQRIVTERGGSKYAVFWLPIENHDDYYIHFAVGMASGE